MPLAVILLARRCSAFLPNCTSARMDGAGGFQLFSLRHAALVVLNVAGVLSLQTSRRSARSM